MLYFCFFPPRTDNTRLLSLYSPNFQEEFEARYFIAVVFVRDAALRAILKLPPDEARAE